MPYRTRSRRVRRTRRKSPWYKRRYNALQLAAKAARGVWYLKGLVNSELLKNDISIPNTTISDAGLVQSCQLMAQGDGDSNRTGNSVLARQLLVRIRIAKASTPTLTYVRAYIVIDTQQIGDTLPTLSELLHTVDVDSPLSRTTAGRFKILWTKTILLTGDKPAYHLERAFKMRHHIRFNGTAGADIQKGGIYLMLLGDQSVSTNYPSLDGHLRLSYHDN